MDSFSLIYLRRLRVLRVLAERGTVTATAVSQQIRRLGRELGVDLLRPDGSGGYAPGPTSPSCCRPRTPPVTDRRSEFQPLLEDVQDLLVPRERGLARFATVELADAVAEPWIVKPDNDDTHLLVSAACAAAGFTPEIAHQAKEWFAVSALVSEGLGVCLLPRLAPIPATHDVVRIPLRGNPVPSRRMVACVRRGSTGQPAIAAGLAALHHVAASY